MTSLLRQPAPTTAAPTTHTEKLLYFVEMDGFVFSIYLGLNTR